MPAEQRAEETKIDAIGVRVVHGGSSFVEPVVVTEEMLDELDALSDLAPLHNPKSIEAIRTALREHRGIPIVAAFDTAFHRTLPPIASRYALPSSIDVRRYGFHGLSYSYIASRLHVSRHIVCHLGSGSSICALRDGVSVDTSMGFTPLEGVVMGTRCGDLDPGVLLHLLRQGTRVEELEDLLHHRSGLLALSETSSDVRDLEKAAIGGDARAELALEIFADRVAKYVAGYATVLNGVDAITFTAGIGEHSASVRQRICHRLSILGVELDERLNATARGDERKISRGRVDVWVIPTNEELEIARECFGKLNVKR